MQKVKYRIAESALLKLSGFRANADSVSAR